MGDDRTSALRRAVRALDGMQARLDAIEGARTEPIAIVGIGCRLPGGAKEPESYWQLLRNGVDAVSEVPPDRWDVDAWYDPDPTRSYRMNTRWGGFLDDVYSFEPSFFGLSPREAKRMDLQQRLLLEVAWEALEDAGCTRQRLAGSETGVFIGASSIDYYLMLVADGAPPDEYKSLGIAPSVHSGRISYVLDLHGPALTVDTACSSSLVAVHLACESLRKQECSMALAAGVNLMLSPVPTLGMSNGRAFAPDGRCKTFDARADGYVRGEGCGVVVLKRLSDALADRDHIRALIRGSAVNQDGRSIGLAAPNPGAQRAVIGAALAHAGVKPARVSYVECHGTGTPLGDPIEIEALTEALGAKREGGGTCAIGSVKTNFGHLEAGAGIAGLIKTALALEHREIPPHLHFTELNPAIRLEDTRFVIPTEARRWESDAEGRVAGVSAFGFSGTNAHVVLEQAPELPQRKPDPEQAQLLLLSARSPEALDALARSHRDLLEGREAAGALDLRDVCYTAALRRTHQRHRLAVVGSSVGQMVSRLARFAPAARGPGLAAGLAREGARTKTVFVFSGWGCQWPGMGRELFEQEPAFRASLDDCDRAFRSHLDGSLIELLADGRALAEDRVDLVQPAIFAVEVALAALWRAWGVEPDAVVGHSSGEVAAAHVAGALSLEDASQVVCERSRLLATALREAGPGGPDAGAMMLASLSFGEALEVVAGLGGRVSVAGDMGPRAALLSGEREALAGLQAELERRQTPARPVEVAGAAHSPLVDPLLAPLRRALRGLKPRAGQVPFHSTVTRGALGGQQLDANYWARNLREPVHFWSTVEALVEDGHGLLLDVSPHPVLALGMQDGLREARRRALALGSLRRDKPERESLLTALGALFAAGHPVDWSRLYGGQERCVALPLTPWQRERLWLWESAAEANASLLDRPRGARRRTQHPLLGERVTSPAHPETRIWQIDVSTDSFPFLKSHRIQGAVLLPSTFYVEMALAAAAELVGPGDHAAQDVRFERALILPEDEAVTLQLVCSPEADGAFSMRFYARSARRDGRDAPWLLHASAAIRPAAAHDASPPVAEIDLDAVRQRCREVDDPERGPGIGSNDGSAAMEGVERVWRRDGESLGLLRLPDGQEADAEGYPLHPALLDGCLRVAARATWGETSHDVHLAVSLEHARVLRRPGNEAWAHATLRRNEPPEPGCYEGEVRLLDHSGQVLVEVLGARIESLAHSLVQGRRRDLANWLYELRWREAPLPPPDPSLAPPEGLLIFADECGVGEALARLLTGAGRRVVLVFPGDRYQRLDADRFRIRPDEPEDLGRLVEATLCSERGTCRELVHLWSLNRVSGDGTSAESLWTGQRLGCLGVMRIIQAIAAHAVDELPRVWLVTRGAQAVADEGEAPALTHAPLWGFGRTIAQEHPVLWGGLVDLDPAAPERMAAAQLLEHLCRGDEEDQVAYRNGRRYVPRLARARRAPAPSRSFQWRRDASYLITGGLGGLGLTVARWMVEQGARRLVLLGRTQLPPRTRWPEIERNGPVAQAARIAGVRALESLGASVHFASVDVGDEDQLRSFLEEFRREGWPPIRGVVHAAAVVHHKPILELDAEVLRADLSPKLAGGWLLHELLSDDPLDFFVLFSSGSSFVSSPFLSSYAAGNAFLDALAHYRRARGLPCLDVNWGTWADVGLAALAKGAGYLKIEGMRDLAPADGLDALGRLLGEDRTQVAVIDCDWAHASRAHPWAAGNPLLSELVHEREDSSKQPILTRERLLEVRPEERPALLQAHLREYVASVLESSASQVDVERPLVDLGVDSLMSIELKNEIERGLRIVMPVVNFLEGTSIAQLATQVLQRLSPDSSRPGHADAGIPKLARANRNIDELLAGIDALSEDEVKQRLQPMREPGFHASE